MAQSFSQIIAAVNIGPSHVGQSLWMRLLFGFLLFALAGAAQYLGAEACAECHPAESRTQSATGHARALRLSVPGEPGDWAFGAGNQAISFVSRLNENDYLEHGQTWYRALNRFDITPGHKGPEGLRYRVFDPSAGILKCFACHSTGPLQVAANGAIEPHEPGVRCEVCHGPGAEHAANPARRLRTPASLNGPEMNAACGACHRVLSAAEGGSSDGSNLLDPWNSRHQPLLLAASTCFQKSAGKLTCLRCHSPHQPLETSLEAYNPACLNCHPAAKHSAAVAGRACAACHMPAVKIDARLAFANHRIAVYSPEDPLAPLTSPKR